MNIILTGTKIRYEIFQAMRSFPEFAERKALRIEKDQTGTYVKPHRTDLWVPVSKEEIRKADLLILPPKLVLTELPSLAEKPSMLFIMEPEILPKDAKPADKDAKKNIQKLKKRQDNATWKAIANVFRITHIRLASHYEQDIDIDKVHTELAGLMAKQVSAQIMEIRETENLLTRLIEKKLYHIPGNMTPKEAASFVSCNGYLLPILKQLDEKSG